MMDFHTGFEAFRRRVQTLQRADDSTGKRPKERRAEKPWVTAVLLIGVPVACLLLLFLLGRTG